MDARGNVRDVLTRRRRPLVKRDLERRSTEAAGANPIVPAQLGYGPLSANPAYEAGWTWLNAGYKIQSGNNDEYQSFTAPAVGTYGYVYRVSVDSGVSWTYCRPTPAPGRTPSDVRLGRRRHPHRHAV